jgi:2-amino-4-hydroxy-6-hydroxymethyldihydropteridine diphosphokinase
MPSTLAAIGLGSNLGDRRAAIGFAADRLASCFASPILSDLIETDPEGEGLESQPRYLNAVLVGETTLTPRQLLDLLLQIEAEYGRTRPFKGAPRSLDLDLILFGDLVVNQPGLEVPHPRFRERFFVLGPLAEIAPDMRDPITGMKVTELLKALLKDEKR